MPRPKKNAARKAHDAKPYQHTTADLAARPEIGTQAHFKKTKPAATYRYDSSLAPELVWDHLSGTTSAPFPAGEHRQVAVKVIDPRGNELLVVKKLEESS